MLARLKHYILKLYQYWLILRCSTGRRVVLARYIGKSLTMSHKTLFAEVNQSLVEIGCLLMFHRQSGGPRPIPEIEILIPLNRIFIWKSEIGPVSDFLNPEFRSHPNRFYHRPTTYIFLNQTLEIGAINTYPNIINSQVKYRWKLFPYQQTPGTHCMYTRS